MGIIVREVRTVAVAIIILLRHESDADSLSGGMEGWCWCCSFEVEVVFRWDATPTSRDRQCSESEWNS